MNPAITSNAGSAVAIGKFDGLHRGHQKVLHAMVGSARKNGLVPTVLTFDSHPNVVLRPDRIPKPLVGPNQKRALILELGVQQIQIIKFDAEFAQLAPQDFVRNFLVPIQANMVFVGAGFKFGSRGSGSFSVLSRLGMEFGFTAIEVPNEIVDGIKISTTVIRDLLDQGKVSQANALLGRNHATQGVVEHGRKIGRTLGYPTANIARDAEGYLPADGVYAGYLTADGVRYQAAHSVGTNDSVEAVPRLLESHVIGRDDLDLYDKQVICEYVAQVRGWAKFNSVDELKLQIAQDVANAKQLLEE